jgi:phosphate:Na+ symporter
MDYLAVIFSLVGGLALFLFGMRILSESLKKAAGDRLKRALDKLTSSRLRGVGTGAVVTAAVQSSSLTTVTLVGLINAGLLSLEGAVPVIMGANIGTTVTAQLISFKFGAFALPILAIGFAMQFMRRDKYVHAGQVILGFGMVFLGMNIMSDGVSPLRSSPEVVGWLATLGEVPVLGILAGAGFTGIIQSSSATTGLVIAMGMGDLIDLKSAIALILGANIGTCVTVLLASIGSSLSSKRAAHAHLIFNIGGVAIFYPFIGFFSQLVALTAAELPRQIANAHTIFNVVTTLILIPFVGILVAVVKRTVKGEEIKIDRGAKFLDKRALDAPAVALSLARRETVSMGKISLSMLRDCEKVLAKYDGRAVLAVKMKEEATDEIDNLIERYLTKIAQRNLSNQQSMRVETMIHNISDIERVADHAKNIIERLEYMEREGLRFSRNAKAEMRKMFRLTITGYADAVRVMSDGNERRVRRVLDIELEIDRMQKRFEKNHLRRLKAGKCDPMAGPVFIDIVRNLERVSDHAHNIAYAIMMGF